MTDSWRDLAAAYALDALDGDERVSFEARLAEDPSLRELVDEYREAANAIGGSLQLREPPTAVRERILRRARESKANPAADEPRTPDIGSGPSTPTGGRPRSSALPWLLLAASVAGLVWLGNETRLLRVQTANLQDELVEVRSLLAGAETELARFDSITPLLAGSNLRFASLTGDGVPGLRLVWSPESNALLVAAVNLPPPPDGRTYQLWGIRGTDAPVSLGTFETSADGTALVTLSPSDQEDFDVSALTEEPAGGSPQPTTTPFLLGPWTTAE